MTRIQLKKSFLLICSWLCYYSLCFSQQLNFTNYTIADGLPQSEVYSMLHDSRGYLWLGTYGGGLSKFDGHSFINYTEKDGLTSNIIFSVAECKSGNIWIGTEAGLTRFNGKKFTRYTITDGLADNIVYDVFCDSKDRLWCATNNGLSYLDNNKFATFYKGGSTNNCFRSILEDNNGVLWFANDNRLISYNGTKFIEYPIPNSSATIWSIITDSSGNIWGALYGGGAFKFKNGRYSFYSTNEGLTSNLVYAVCKDKKGNLWFGTDDKGIFMFDGTKFNHYTIKQGLIDNRVRAILYDQEGNLWFAAGSGLSKYRKSRFVAYTNQDGIASNIVNSICQDRKGNMWFGTQEGLTRYDGKKYKTFTTHDGLPHNRIWNVVEDNKGILWISTHAGISKYDGKRFVNCLLPNVSYCKKIVYASVQDQKGNMWFGISDELCRYDGEKLIRVDKKKGCDIKSKIKCLLSDHSNNIWIGTRDAGIMKYDGHNLKSYSEKDGLGKNTIAQMAEDKLGNIWIATYGGGLSIYNTKTNKFSTITSKNGLMNDALLSVVFDNDGYLWIGCLKGVDQFNWNVYTQTGKIEIKHYTSEDGFAGTECMRNAAYKDSRGNIWFGTIGGSVKIDLSKTEADIPSPIVHINNMKLFYKSINTTIYSDSSHSSYFITLPIGLKLPYNQNHITMNYSGICLSAPQKVRYKYKMEGYDEDWSPSTKETFSTYPNMPPGKYTFLVKASNNESLWNVTPEKYSFEITPPFWQRWWFYLLCAVVITYSLILVVLRHLRKERIKKIGLNKKIIQQRTITYAIIEALEQERKRVSEELHDGLGQVFVAIKLNLNALESLIEKAGIDKKNNYNTSLLLVNHATKELRNISHAMRSSHLDSLGLESALEILCKNFEQTSVFKCDFISSGIKKRLGKPIEIALYRICQELLTNVIKHANATELIVQLIRHEGSIVMMVEDNGSGFKSDKKIKKTGIGLENIKSRVELLKGTFTIDSSQENGTSVVVEIPLNG